MDIAAARSPAVSQVPAPDRRRHQSSSAAPNDLLGLIADVMAAQHLVLASLELKLAPMEMRRSLPAQLARLLRLSWLNQRIVEAITSPMSPYEESVRVVERPIWGA